MKKALIVTNLIGFVGFLWNDIRILQKHGYEVSLAANAEVITDEEHLCELKEARVVFYQLPFSSKNPIAKENLEAYREIKAILKKEKFDLVHCHTPIAGFITRFATRKHRRLGTKVLYTSHGLSFSHLSSKKQWMTYFYFEKIASFFTDTIITINREDFENAKKFACKDIRLINGVGVDTKFYHDVELDVQKYKKKLGLPTNKIMILSVGELSTRKNHQIIIKALGLLQNKEQYIYVICGREVGGSGFAEDLQKQAKENGVELYLLGHRKDIPEIMHCSDIGAIPSVREGLGLAGIQSLCAGVPLVGTRVQGIQDYIFDGINGYLCEPYDEKSFAEAITRLSDVELRKKMKQECYRVAQCFDVEVSHRQMEDIYASVL